jgi:hypothetical protein
MIAALGRNTVHNTSRTRRWRCRQGNNPWKFEVKSDRYSISCLTEQTLKRKHSRRMSSTLHRIIGSKYIQEPQVWLPLWPGSGNLHAILYLLNTTSLLTIFHLRRFVASMRPCWNPNVWLTESLGASPSRLPWFPTSKQASKFSSENKTTAIVIYTLVGK